LNGIYHKNVETSGVDYIQGKATFTAAKEVEVSGGGGGKYSAEHVMIASGSTSFRPSKFGFKGEEHCITSDDIFALEKLPESMVIIGGGYIGTEMAGIMASFGVKVTLIVRDLLLARVDQEIVDMLIENMKKHKIDVKMLASSNEVTKDQHTGELTVHMESGEKLILLARHRQSPQYRGDEPR